MRILLNYRYSLAPVTTAYYLERAILADSSLSVFRVGQDRVPCADLILNVEPCDRVITYPGIPCAYWEIDNHIHLGKSTDVYGAVDFLFVAQKYFSYLYPSGKTHVLPLAADPDIHKLYADEPVLFDIGFIGNDSYPRRRRLLEVLKQKYHCFFGNDIFGEEYARRLSSCRLLFNCSLNHDVNMRFFESMSIGRLLLSDYLGCQDALAKSGVHYVAYSGEIDLLELVDYYLNHEKEREKIASAGAAYIRAKHTYAHRLEEILRVCNFY